MLKLMNWEDLNLIKLITIIQLIIMITLNKLVQYIRSMLKLKVSFRKLLTSMRDCCEPQTSIHKRIEMEQNKS